jgi:hypothetical protein
MTKFKVGDRVKHSISGILGTVEHVLGGASSYPYTVGWDNGVRQSAYTIRELMSYKEETVSNKLPPEPVAGQYYRTRDGTKTYFIGKSSEGAYLYQAVNSNFLRWYAGPYLCTKTVSNHNRDIIAPWTDEPRPSVPIRRWALVSTVTRKEPPRASRGEVMRYCDSLEEAEEERGEEEEIVELVGTLPAREV